MPEEQPNGGFGNVFTSITKFTHVTDRQNIGLGIRQRSDNTSSGCKTIRRSEIPFLEGFKIKIKIAATRSCDWGLGHVCGKTHTKAKRTGVCNEKWVWRGDGGLRQFRMQGPSVTPGGSGLGFLAGAAGQEDGGARHQPLGRVRRRGRWWDGRGDTWGPGRAGAKGGG